MKKIYIILLILNLFTFSFSAKAQLVYKDVAPIFYSRCTTCHHEDQHAPSMMNYSETFSLKSSIQNDLQIGKMPPWSPDTTYKRFVHEHIITTSERNDILSWISSGALKGDTTLAPSAPLYSHYLLTGAPSLILQIPTFTSNASSTDSYVCFSIPSGLTQDRVLRAYEIVPGNPAIVHHVIVNIDTTGTTTTDLSGQCFNPPGNIGIGGYAPGALPIVFPGQFPLKAGINIKAGSNIVLQIHYPVGTAGQQDSTQIRMYFYPLNETGIRQVHNSVPMQNWALYMPANTVTSFSDTYPNSGTLTTALSMFATFPHSHKVCKSIINYAYAGTDTIPLVRINNWDFNWQGYYVYPNLVKIPAGYKLFSKHVYDNTVNNPNNPNSPPALVIAGTSTTDEMLFDAYLWFEYEPGDELIDVAGMLANDPLLNPVGIKEIIPPLDFQAFVYPNPASDKLSIYLSKKSQFKVRILNISGQTILQTETLTDNVALDLKNIPAGLYIVQVIDSKTKERITKKIIITK